MKIEEVLAKMTDIQHRIAVYSSIIEHLEDYLPSDVGESGREIIVDEGCLTPKVNHTAIESVLNRVHELYENEKKDLGALSSLEAKTNGTKRKSTPRKPARKSAAKRGKS